MIKDIITHMSKRKGGGFGARGPVQSSSAIYLAGSMSESACSHFELHDPSSVELRLKAKSKPIVA